MSDPRQPLVPRPDDVQTVVSPTDVVAGLVFVGVGLAIALPASRSLGVGTSMGVILLLALVFVGLSGAFNRLGARRFQPINAEGIAALVRGELDRAARTFEPGMRRWSVSARCTARHNLGVTRARQGDLRGAIELFAYNVRHRLRGALRAQSALELTICLALVGELELAEAWSIESERRVAKLSPGMKAAAAYARAVLDCRRGRSAEAALALQNSWADIEGHSAVAFMRPIRVVRAFAETQTTGPRDAGLTERLLVDARPRFSGEYDWLGAEWPEMRMFLEANDLAQNG